MTPRHPRRWSAFTLMELMVVISIIAVLAAMAFPVYTKLQRLAEETVCVNGLKQIVSATMTWAAEHSDKLPSPRYSGSEKELPDYWKLDSDGEPGLWLNGVIYAQLYIEDPQDAPTGGEPLTGSASGVSNLATSGKHLVGTVFESRVSTKRMPEERDWYRHSYAMNANLMYDEIALLSGASDPWLTEKSVSKFEPVAAMIYIDCIDQNIVMASDYGLIVDAADKRYDGKRLLAAYLDGHVAKMHPNELPDEDPESDREASLFWRGVLPDR